MSVIIGFVPSMLMINIYPIFSPYTHFDMVVRSAVGFYIIIQGIRDVQYAFNHREDQNFYPRRGLLLNEKSLEELLEQSVVGGMGSIQNPYKFVDLTNFPSKVFIRKMDCYFALEGLNLEHLYLKRCKNIVINSNKINRLRISSSSDVCITNNSSYTIMLNKSIGNFIHNNKLSKPGLKLLEIYKKGEIVSSRVDKLIDILFCISIIIGGLIFYIFQLFIVLYVYVGTLLFALLYLKSIRKRNFYEKVVSGRPNIISNNIFALY